MNFIVSLIVIAFGLGIIICLLYAFIVISFNLFNKDIRIHFLSKGWNVLKIRKRTFKELINKHPFDDIFTFGGAPIIPYFIRIVKVEKNYINMDLYVLVKFRYFKPCKIIVEDGWDDKSDA
jgi:hypothetical protein